MGLVVAAVMAALVLCDVIDALSARSRRKRSN
jgi:hypothetical protein